ncbi:uncharacterized protein LOC128509848 [Clarias gariepinus]|uniref:uncharacterized protein LOC128509848 n=1 Tax=Clarias gariepinus TaxID=13013 RepID=UPI00234E17FB|nr:uncharacterized protein LOC128509848 [Clarias gariepinus]XP_053337682.1 uncharacterized protein LOC128509848 [Clarias gariepinus]
MQSCSVHHCVLFLLTLTLTTDPGSATCVFPIYAKLHQSVTLPCEAPCSGQAKWSLDSNRDDVFAQCDQTSCRSVQKGFNMSYDQFKKGDLSLTITKPDYSMRKSYTCECDYSDYATVNLRIFTVSSAVQVKPEGDLTLHVSVSEPVEVIHKSSDSADGVQICTVTNRTLQCKSEYTPRTSLSYPELTLRDVMPWDSGTYTIRNLDYKEDIRVYAVSVSAVFSAVPVQTGEDLKLDVSVPESVLKVEVIYRSSVSAVDVQICTVTNRTLQCKSEYTPRTSLSYPELTLRGMGRSESRTYTIRNLDYKEDIRVYAVSVSGTPQCGV